MININKLKGKIVEHNTSVAKLAIKLGMDKATLYRKLRDDGKKLTVFEAVEISKELKLTLDEINEIFFNL